MLLYRKKQCLAILYYFGSKIPNIQCITPLTCFLRLTSKSHADLSAVPPWPGKLQYLQKWLAQLSPWIYHCFIINSCILQLLIVYNNDPSPCCRHCNLTDMEKELEDRAESTVDPLWEYTQLNLLRWKLGK